MNLLAVGLGGCLGALARYGVSSLLANRSGALPQATLAVNLVGCLLIGALWLLLEETWEPAEPVRLFLSVGFLGGLTTYSTFGLETAVMLREGAEGRALLFVLLQLGLGLGAVFLGRALARLAF